MESGLSRTPSEFESQRILVIDDEPLVRESIAIYLEDSGYQIIEAADGKQGVELFCEFSPDLVLCDLRMPKVDGLEVLKTVTRLSPNTPIIMISGAGQIHDVVEALRLGALDYLVKPITDMAVLQNAVTNALRRQQLEKENLTYRKELELANVELEKNLGLLRQDQDAGRRAQLQLLPEPDARICGVRLQHRVIPSLNLSGDFIDYFQISERFLGFYIADVSGHGAAAAFVTMTLKSFINQPLRQYRLGENASIIDPAKFLSYLNEALIEANLGKHITIFYAVLDCDTNQLLYSMAGQYPAPLVRNHGKIGLLSDGGFPIGLFEWASFENNQISVASDFKLLMVSDGWLQLIADDTKPSQESFLLDFVAENVIDIPTLLKPMKALSKDSIPDDVTIFIVSKE